MPRILLVDDDMSLLAALSTSLEEAGYDVVRASSAETALQKLEERPDLVLLEVAVNDGRGWDVLDAAVADQVPVIVLTRHAREEEIVDALESGASDVLGKPYRTNELLARLRTRLGPVVATRAPAEVAVERQVERRPHEPHEPSPFMDHANERQLVYEPIEQLSDMEQPVEQLPLGQRLRAARQLRRQSLVQASLETPSKIAISYLQAMEEEKFGLLPRGALAAKMVREYADYLGLDATKANADYFANHDVSPFRPLPSLGGRPLAGALLALLLLASLAAFSAGARNRLGNLQHNVRGAFARATATATATVTPPPPTVTPTASRTPTATATAVPTATSSPTMQPTATPLPTPSPAGFAFPQPSSSAQLPAAAPPTVTAIRP
ncbi:MAG: hypothetical protein NVS4B8_08400 [Herpetosiphon sp.]